jgi:exodeoxyribonuclease-5
MHRAELERRIIRESRPVEVPTVVELTETQQQAVEVMLDFENSGDEHMLLTGHAGTGKTTTVAEYLKHTEKNVVLVAPTNKAVRVLCNTAGQHGITVPCMTVHKLLDLIMSSDDKEKYCRKRDETKNLMARFDIVVVDECSMVGNIPKGREELGLYDQLVEEARRYGTKLIFVGDRHQLPPVKESGSPSLDVEPYFRLTEVVRQAADNPIIQLADWLRRIQDGEQPGEAPEPKLVNGCGVHSIKTRAEFENIILEHFRNDPDSPDLNRVVCWRWERINPFARRLLDALHPGHEDEVYVSGVRYYATEPVLNQDNPGDGPLMHMITDEDAVLQSVRECDHPDRRFGKYRTLRLEFEKDNEDGGERFGVYVVHPDDEPRFRRDVVMMKAAAVRREIRWTQFWGMGDAYNFDLGEKKLCCRLKPHYVTTVHKAQGSTYQNVFVDYPDIADMPVPLEKLRCLYTACTRGAKNLFVLEGGKPLL